MPENGVGVAKPLGGTGMAISSGEVAIVCAASPGMWIRLASFW